MVRQRAQALGWEELRTVHALLRHGTLAEAARALGIDATTVGRRLATAEKRAGATLFERTGTAITPTDRARGLADDLASMESSALAIESSLSASPELRGTVKLALSDAFAQYFLVGELAAILRRLPGIELELVTGHRLADLLRREADLALRFVRPTQPDLVARRLASVRWSLYGARSYLARRERPDPERGLAGHRLIRWAGPPLRPALSSWLDAHAFAAETTLSAHGLHVMVEACGKGLGLALLPGPMALGRGLERAIDGALDTSEHWLVMHRHTRQLPRVRAVADVLYAHLHEARDRISAI